MSNSYLYTCYFDLVGSSSSNLTIHQQIAKLENLNNFVREIFYPAITYPEMLKSTPSPSYLAEQVMGVSSALKVVSRYSNSLFLYMGI